MKNTLAQAYIANLKSKAGRAVDLFSNFAHLENHTKILVLDSIIDHAKDVFGPYSGVYGEVIMDYNNVAEGEFVAENCQYVKTSDGASFFSRINFGNRYGVTILKSIQQQTKYLAGFNDNTSRDGTTSLAMIGAITAKNLLMYDELCKLEIPKNIRTLIKDVIGYSATTLMKDDAIQIYDADKKQYLKNDNFDGFNWALNAINTTVGNTPGFRDAFEKVMRESVENGFDITSTYMLKPEKRIGNYKIDIEIEAGIKMKTSALSQTKVEAFKDNVAHTFILGGYIAPHNSKVYEAIFKEWIKELCLTKDENGLLIYSKYNRNFKGLPLILVTRMSAEQEDFYKKISTEGYSFTMNVNGQAVKETIRPIIMLAHDTDGKAHYQDATDVYSEILIDLNAINTKINSLRLAPLEYNDKGTISPTVLSKAEDVKTIASMLPIINNNKVTVDRCESDWSEDGLSKEVKESETFTYDDSKFILRTSFDGYTFLMSSEDEEIIERMKLKRESLFNMKNNFSDTANADMNIEARINYMSGISLKPVIYVRTDDDYHNFVNLLDDALGVFQSVHIHGIMPGSNSWILKRGYALREKVYIEANRVISKVVQNKELLEKYTQYAVICVDLIYEAYKEAYTYIDREDPDKRIEEYLNIKKFNEVYNVITGVYDDSILEAARTTSDVFIGSLYVGFDLLDLKRVRVTNYNEWMEVHNRNKEYNYHKSNNRLDIEGEENDRNKQKTK